MRAYPWTCTLRLVLFLSASPLEICLPTLIFFSFEILLFLFFPQFRSFLPFLTRSLAIKLTVLALLLLLVFLLINLSESRLPAWIYASSFYSNVLLPFVVIPLNRVGCFLLLLLYHSSIRFRSPDCCVVERSISSRHSYVG